MTGPKEEGNVEELRKTPRVFEFVTLDGILRLTGCKSKKLVTFMVKELIDNALDKKEVQNVFVGVIQSLGTVTVYVADDGIKLFTREMLDKVLDFTSAPSTKRGLKGIKRGVIGNALQCCFGISHALWDDEARPPYTAEVVGETYCRVGLRISNARVEPIIEEFKPDSVEKCLENLDNKIREIAQNSKKPMTLIVFRLPAHEFESPFGIVEQIAILNPNVNIHYREHGETFTFKARRLGGISYEMEGFGDVWWYTYAQFRDLASKFHALTAQRFLMMFKRFRDPRNAKSTLLLAEIQAKKVISELTEEELRRLFHTLKEKKPISPRNLPVVGEALMNEMGATKYVVRYKMKFDGERAVPFAIEAAAFPSLSGEGKIQEAINFTASLYRPFTKWVWNVKGERITLYDIVNASGKRVLIHLVCPNITWLSPSKGEMAELDLFEKTLLNVVKNVCKDSLAKIKEHTIIARVKKILEEYRELSFSVRQIFYRLVALYRYSNTRGAYNKLIKILRKARENRLIEAERIVDYSRPEYYNNPSTKTLEEYMKTNMKLLIEEFDLDRWVNQKIYVEVWIEKEALSRVILPTCKKYRVNLIVGKGYSSYTQVYKATTRFPAGKPAIILYFGDHDPPGLHIEEKLRERLKEELKKQGKEIELEVRRIALNYRQVFEYALPPSPIKKAGQKHEEYLKSFGEKVWELDALDPKTLVNLLEEELKKLIDRDAWKKREKEIEEHKKKLAEKIKKSLPEYCI
ncbi:MAG: hypothetical protein QXV01_04440 [Candidatus Bathyarchaeia archaeon]